MNALAVAVKPRVTSVMRGATMLGPALVAAAAYVDPGNVATNTTAGARYGYLLLWVVAAANVMAGLVQYLSAKLGVVSGRSLPEVLRERLPRSARLMFWAQAEIVSMATDVAEVVGGAIALSLLFHLPLLLGGVITAVVSMAILSIQARRGQRRFEYIVAAMLLIVMIGFVAGLFVRTPDAGAAAAGLIPGFADRGSVLIAAGMLGATIMPHAIYLHSALARDRHGRPAPGPARRRLLTATKADVTIALVFAGAANLALLLLGATALGGDTRSDTLVGVHTALGQTVGPVTALLFAVALLFSGLASSSVGCYAGSVVMQGLLNVRVPMALRRLVTAIPAIIVLTIGVDPTEALIVSQVVLSFGIPFALIPLVVLTSRRSVMGEDRNRLPTVLIASAVAGAVVTLNLALLYLTFAGIS